MQNETTQRGYPLPHEDNPLYFDVDKIRDSLTAIDADMTKVENKTNVEIPNSIQNLTGGVNAARNIITGGIDSDYANNRTYAVGAYCKKDGVLYRCTTAITTAEEWNAEHWQRVVLLNEIASVQTAANNALNAAQTAQATIDEVIENGVGGSGSTIKLTFAAEFVGQPYTFTNGTDETKNGVVPDSRTVNISVIGCNTTYTVTSTAGGIEYSNSITTGDYYSQYVLNLTVFTANIRVTAPQCSRVLATLGNSTYEATANASNLAVIEVKRAGSYTVYATKDDVTSSTATVNVTTSGAIYNTEVNFITLILTSPTGCSITVSNGSTNLTATSTGSNLFYLPNAGTWTATITKSGDTAEGSVEATTYTNYTLEVAFVHIYGVEWDGTSTPIWTRTDEAALFTDPVPYKQGMTAAQCSSPFDNVPGPWRGMEKTTIDGNVVVKIPKFWYKLTRSGAKGLKIQIADKPVAGFHTSPAHMDRGDGKGERDLVYVGRYHCGSSAWKSVSGEKPKTGTGVNRSGARTAIHNLGANYWQLDFATWFTIWLLYLVEFANWNSQAKIGYGCGNNSGNENTGASDTIPYHTGTRHATRETYGVGIQYRWLEDLWANVYDWLDGCYYNNSGLNLIKKPSDFSDSAGGVVVGTPSNGWPSAFAISEVDGYPMIYPTEASGSESTFSCDHWSFNAGYPCLCAGGNFSQYTYLGLFCVYCTDATDAYAFLGCRLQILP